jgi:hypothetical protein
MDGGTRTINSVNECPSKMGYVHRHRWIRDNMPDALNEQGGIKVERLFDVWDAYTAANPDRDTFGFPLDAAK